MDTANVIHPFPPLYDRNSRILILGTMPSPVSRKCGFYYTHKRNRFWPVIAGVFAESVPVSNEERASLALRHGLALWDVLRSCDINGASDSTIRSPYANDISGLISKSSISHIVTTGTKAFDLYTKLCLPSTGIEALPLPSTSPQNLRFSLEDLIIKYSVLKDL